LCCEYHKFGSGIAVSDSVSSSTSLIVTATQATSRVTSKTCRAKGVSDTGTRSFCSQRASAAATNLVVPRLQLDLLVIGHCFAVEVCLLRRGEGVSSSQGARQGKRRRCFCGVWAAHIRACCHLRVGQGSVTAGSDEAARWGGAGSQQRRLKAAEPGWAALESSGGAGLRPARSCSPARSMLQLRLRHLTPPRAAGAAQQLSEPRAGGVAACCA